MQWAVNVTVLDVHHHKSSNYSRLKINESKCIFSSHFYVFQLKKMVATDIPSKMVSVISALP